MATRSSRSKGTGSRKIVPPKGSGESSVESSLDREIVGSGQNRPDAVMDADTIKLRIALLEAETKAEEARAERESVRRRERVEEQRALLELERERVSLREREAALPGRTGSSGSVPSGSGELSVGRDREVVVNAREISAPMREDKPDVPAFFNAFEKACQVRGVPDSQWSRHIVVLLGANSKAQAAYSRLSVESASDYAKIKEAVLDYFRLTPEEYLQLFREATRGQDESYVQMAARFEDLQRYYLEGQQITSFEALKQEMLREQVRNSLPSDLRAYVDEKRPKSLAKLVEYCDRWDRQHSRQAVKATGAPAGAPASQRPHQGTQGKGFRQQGSGSKVRRPTMARRRLRQGPG
jgi:SCAN domain